MAILREGVREGWNFEFLRMLKYIELDTFDSSLTDTERLGETMKFLKPIVCLLVLALSGCTAAGGLRPSSFTYPSGYLKSFPLGTVTAEEMLQKVGPPDNTIEVSGKKAFVYQIGSGRRTYTYVFDGGTVSDVIYNENGILNGSTAKLEQKK